MYTHFMVPVDGSVLSSANVDEAIKLANRLGAKITFFHATTDLGATGDGAELRSIAPTAFVEAAMGETHGVLSKARASANAAGVSCDVLARTCDRPAEAIVAASQSQGCDLIVMASRGVKGLAGLLHSSQTERVLRQSPVALLVTRVSSIDPLNACERALAVIQDEHRSIAVVVKGMQDLQKGAIENGTVLDLSSMEAILAYMQAFPLQLHHPKEEQFLHRWMRQRVPSCEPVLKSLEDQHIQEHELVAEAVRCVRAAKNGDLPAGEMLSHIIPTLAEAVWCHLRLEEDTILPLARQYLHDDDWSDIAGAFAGNSELGFDISTTIEFQKMFTKIANQLNGSSSISL
jgi:nucleotide-binding universal stress UspA family protein/hemerythrin-like domain-containing protein